MAITLFPYIRDDACYVPDHAENDPGYRPMGLTMRVQPGKLHEPEDYDGRTHQRVELQFSRPVTQFEALQAAYDQFARGCSCEHDCCGHLTGGASLVIPTTRNGKPTRARRTRHYRAVLAYARNY
jgi:hypothetical protein